MRLRTVNHVLTVISIGLGLYLIIMPFLPKLAFGIKKQTQKTIIQQQIATYNKPVPPKDIPKDNRLVIPALLLNEPIHTGSSISVIEKGGTWLRPGTAKPTELGNTVIVGHRFTYQGASTFYNLDKLNTGDNIVVFWEGRQHLYDVYERFVTHSSDASVETKTDNSILTLYTCTPLWTSKQRLVIRARMQELL